jgi:hypothetical protein
MEPDKLVSRATTITVLFVAIVAAVQSFAHIYALAETHGQFGVSALLPLSVDGTITAMSLTLLYVSWQHIEVPWLARVMLWLAVLATLAANVGYGLKYGYEGALISAWPAVAFIGCVETILQLGKNKRNSAVIVPDGRTFDEVKADWEFKKNGPIVVIPADTIDPSEAAKAIADETINVPKQVRKKRGNGPSVAHIQKAAHCDQKRATRIRDLIRNEGYALDKAILIDEETYPRRGNANETLHADEDKQG